MGSTDGLALLLLQAVVIGETLAGVDPLEKPLPPPYLLEKKYQLAKVKPLTSGVGMQLPPL